MNQIWIRYRKQHSSNATHSGLKLAAGVRAPLVRPLRTIPSSHYHWPSTSAGRLRKCGPFLCSRIFQNFFRNARYKKWSQHRAKAPPAIFHILYFFDLYIVYNIKIRCLVSYILNAYMHFWFIPFLLLLLLSESAHIGVWRRQNCRSLRHTPHLETSARWRTITNRREKKRADKKWRE